MGVIKSCVWGKIEFLICYQSEQAKHEALELVNSEINSDTTCLDGHLYCADGRVMPLIIKNVNIKWLYAEAENEF